MSRLPRIHLEGVLYYITSRGDMVESIFKEPGDYQMYLELLSKYKNQHRFKLFSYVLVSDHLHLLIELKEGAKLSVIMHNLNSSYTKYFNSKYQRKGHLFRERFKAVIVEKEPYLLNLTCYIHLNPVRLNLVSNVKDYPYSSYHIYIRVDNSDERVGLDELKEVLGYLKEKRYEDFVSEGLSDEADTLHKGLHRGGILGSEGFVKGIKERLKEYSKDRASLEAPKATPDRKSRYIAIGVFTFLFLSGLSILYFYKTQSEVNRDEEVSIDKGKEISIGKGKEINREPMPAIFTELNGTEWEIKLVSLSGEQPALSDVLSFIDGRFISGEFSSKGYPSSNYTLYTEADGRLVWETMQTAEKEKATVFWRGEVDGIKMTGVVSMSSVDGKSQDFSFVSVNYRKVR